MFDSCLIRMRKVCLAIFTIKPNWVMSLKCWVSNGITTTEDFEEVFSGVYFLTNTSIWGTQSIRQQSWSHRKQTPNEPKPRNLNLLQVLTFLYWRRSLFQSYRYDVYVTFFFVRWHTRVNDMNESLFVCCMQLKQNTDYRFVKFFRANPS